MMNYLIFVFAKNEKEIQERAMHGVYLLLSKTMDFATS
jgi:hypothetical protein